MKQRPIFYLSLLSSFLFFNSCQDSTIPIKKNKEAVSGAYQSLNFLGEARVYPDVKYPTEAHFAAWEKTQNQVTLREDTAPWESMGPHNRGGRTLTLTFNPQNPNTMYAGSASGGLWRTYTGGFGVQGWELMDTGFPVLAVSTIAFAPSDSTVMYIGTGEVYNVFAAGTGAAYRSTRGSYGMGILKSVDGGENWALSLDWTEEQTRGIWRIIVDENNPNNVWTATTHGVYKSEDAGGSWTQKLDVVMANDIVINPNNTDEMVVACGNFGSIGFGIYKSLDGGDNWVKIENGLPTDYLGKIQLARSPSEENVLWASIGNGFSFADGATWLVKSVDFGGTWEIINQEDYSIFQGWFAHDVAIDPTNGENLVTVGITVWNSNDGGESLINVTDGGIGNFNPVIGEPDGPPDFVHSDSHDVIYHPNDPNIVYIACDGGVYRSEDGGTTWRSLNGGYQTAQFYNGFSTSKNDSTLCLGGLQDNGTWVWEGDLSWHFILGGDGAWTAIDPDNDDILFASSQAINIYKITNEEMDYEFLSTTEINPVAFIAPYVVDKINGNTIYVGTAGIAKSTNQGQDWTISNSSNFDGNPFLSMEISPQNTSVVYGATAPFNGQRGHVYVTKNGGTEWADITGNLPDRYPMDMTVSPVNEGVAFITFSGFGEGHLFRTDDYGENWEDISTGLPDVPTNAVVVDPLLPHVVYVGNDIGVFYSVDGGDTWNVFQEGLPTAVMVFDIKISDPNRKLRIATHGNGAYQRDLIDSTLDTEEIVSHFDFNIFPNPFARVITLKYQLEKAQKINIDWIDVSGRILENIVSETQSVGEYQFEISTDDLTSGVYFLRFESENGSFVKQMVK